VNNDILVVEIKEDGDASDENKAKPKHAREHFDRVKSILFQIPLR